MIYWTDRLERDVRESRRNRRAGSADREAGLELRRQLRAVYVHLAAIVVSAAGFVTAAWLAAVHGAEPGMALGAVWLAYMSGELYARVPRYNASRNGGAS